MNVIGINWGSAHRHAYWVGSDGQLLGQRDDAAGVLNPAGQNFDTSLRQFVGDWLDAGPTRVWLWGMVGSKLGWREARHQPLPASLDELALVATRVPGLLDIRIVPGICQSAPVGPDDVMRGEETRLLGARQLVAQTQAANTPPPQPPARPA